jgi:hypothetical protein
MSATTIGKKVHTTATKANLRNSQFVEGGDAVSKEQGKVIPIKSNRSHHLF